MWTSKLAHRILFIAFYHFQGIGSQSIICIDDEEEEDDEGDDEIEILSYIKAYETLKNQEKCEANLTMKSVK